VSRSSRARRRPTLRAPEAIGGVVARVRAGPGATEKATVSREVWETAVGARIAERAQPIEIDHGTLVVRVATSVWASELSLLAIPLLSRLRTAGVEVLALRCRVGAIEAPVRTTALRNTLAVPPPLPVPAALMRELALVLDPELRETIAGAARANLAWQAYVGDTNRVGGGAPTSGASRAARVPQSSERGSGPPDQTSATVPAAPPRRP